MNITHRSIWNAALGAWVAVSEITRACGKRSGAAVALVLVGASVGAQSVSIDGGASVTVPVPQSSPWDISGPLFVGDFGQGTLTVNAGGEVSNTSGYLGLNFGSTGNATVTGADATWTNTSSLSVGSSGTGTLTVQDGGKVSNTFGFIGDGPGAIGHATVTGAGSTWTNSNSLAVGNEGTGTLTVSDGGKVSNTTGSLGNYSSGIGQATVTGAGSTWINSRGLDVGYRGTGTLTVQDGGTVSNTGGSLGYFSGATGHATVTGAGSTWNSSFSFTVGGEGTGTLTVQDGGKVSTNFGTIGESPGGTGNATVTGANSTWTNTGTLYVGHFGNGTLTVQDGGTVSNTSSYLGEVSGSTGNATVTGANSAWISSGNLTVGESGTGRLTVADGGRVSVSNGTGVLGAAENAGSTGVLNIGAAAGSPAAAAGTVAAGEVRFGAGTGSLNFNHTETAYTFGTSVTGTGVVNHYAGTTILTGANTYTGGTTINGGTVSVTTDANLGNAAGGLVFGGGTLQTTNSLSMLRATTLNAGGGTFDTAASTTLTHGGDIAGTGALTKTGTGTMILSGTNNYTGGTTVSGGTLQGNTTSLQGNITNNAAIVFDQTTNGSYAGVMSGSGTLSKSGTGTLTLSGTNSYMGGTTVTGGTVAITADANLGNTAGGLTFDGGTLQMGAAVSTARAVTLNVGGGTVNTNGNNATLSGDLSGTGALTKTGTGTMILSGANNYSGGTTVSGGTLQGSTTSLQGNITNNATVVFDQIATGTYTGAISGNGAIHKTGTGNLILTGTNTYTGTTAISGGTLSVNGSITSPVTVNSGGALGGSGTINGAVGIGAGGVFAPGNSIGTITVNGNLSFAAGSIYRVEVDAAGNADRINVTGAPGTAALNGTVDVQAGAGTYAANTQYTILNAAGGRTGTFAGVTSNLAFLTPTLAYDANNVFLSLARNDISFSAVATTPNQIAISTALQNANASATGDMNRVINAVTGLSAEQARAAYDSVAGTGLVALRKAGTSFAAGLGNQLQARLGAVQGASSAQAGAFAGGPILLAANDRVSDLMPPVSDSPQKFSLASATPLPSASSAQRRGFWLRGSGGYQDTKSDGNATASDLRSSSISAGFDTQLQDGLVVGAALSSGTARLGFNNTDTGKSRGSAVALYGSYASGPWAFKGSASAAWASNQMDRAVAVGAINRTASSDFDSNTLSAYGEATYNLPMNGWTLQPLAGLAFSRNKTDGFTETGAGALNLQVAGQSVNSSQSLLGAKASFEAGNLRLEPRVIWAHEFGDLNTPMTAQFQGAATASPFQVAGVALKRDTLILGLGASGSIGKGVELFADVQTEHNSRQNKLAVLAGVRARW